jgi:membrane-bound lytic murein transglycosylase D
VLLAAARVDRPSSDNGRRQRQSVHRVRAGETLASIARRQGIPVGTLAQLNNLNPGDAIVTGQRLVIKASVRRYRDEGVSEGKRVLYTVRKGDTVFSIAHQYQVTIAQLNTWNGLNKHHQIHTGQRLVMYIGPNRSPG